MRISDWSSDVCSSDLGAPGAHGLPAPGHPPAQLRAEAAQAGVQARGVRTVQRHAVEGQARGHLAAGARAHPQRGRSEEHTSGLQSLMRISYAVFCLKKKNSTNTTTISYKPT